jgi:amino acid adenylation domain-containing protein
MLNGQTIDFDGRFAQYNTPPSVGASQVFWTSYLTDLPRLVLPFDFVGRRVTVPIPLLPDEQRAPSKSGALKSALRDIRRSRDRLILLGGQFVPLNRVAGTSQLPFICLAALKVLLARYCQQGDIAVGSRGLQNNCLSKSREQFLPVRTQIDLCAGFRSAFHEVRKSFENAIAHEPVAGSPIQPLQVGYAFYSRTRSTNPASRLEPRPSGDGDFDLFFIFEAGPAEVEVSVDYDAYCFKDGTIRRILKHLRTLFQSIRENPDLSLSQLPLLPEEERQTLFLDWNTPKQPPSTDKCLHQLFEEQVELSPNAVAISFDGDVLTYEELNRRANKLANYLKSFDVQPGALVGLCVERGFNMIVGLLGILKAGAAYVPLDPAYPAERLDFMIADSEVGIVVGESALAKTLRADNAKFVCLDSEEPAIAACDDTTPVSNVRPDDLAYVIYTSGSTGQPKGALITHENVVRLFGATRDWFDFRSNDVWTLFHSYAFDFSVWEIWGALLHGSRLAIVPHSVSRSPADFLELLYDQRVTVLNQTPSAFRQLMAADESVGKPLQLRYVIFGGEALEFASLSSWFARHRFDSPSLVNMYGITETTVHVTYFPLTEDNFRRSIGSNIGVRIPDLTVYILDRALQPVPIGIPGEMFVGGPGLARGYLNRPELTQERFISNPFDPQARLYKTGDLARFLPDGNIEYLGRIDQQVKIRGFRVELGEIETVLNRHPSVRESAVLVKTDDSGAKRLTAYLVAKAPALLDDLRNHLSRHLPEYMIPASFVLVDSFPLTSNGKLQRSVLGETVGKMLVVSGDFQPASEAERTIASIWCDVLRLPEVSVDQNFFDAGGDSLNVTELQVRLRSLFGETVTVPLLFEHTTVRALAKFLTSQDKANFSRAISERASKQKEAYAGKRKKH